MRLSRKHTMSKRTDFLRVRKTGRAKAGRFLIVSTLEDPGLERLKFAIITTRRVGKAHERNRLRRQIRAILQRHSGALAEPRRFLVTIPRPGCATATFAQLEKDWLKQARRLALLTPPERP